MTSDGDDLLRRLIEGPNEPVVEAPKPLPTTMAVTPATTFDEDWDANLPAREPDKATARSTLARARLRYAARLGLFTLAAAGGLLGLGELWIHLINDPLADARAYYDAASRLNAGHALYPAGADPNAAEFYRYPPLLAVVLRPFALLPYEWFALLWEAAIVGSFVTLVRHLGARSQRTWLTIGLLGIPIGWALAIGQAQVPLTLLLAIGQPWSIALATNLTLFPALIVVWWIGRREWQAMAAFAAWMFLFGLAQVLLEPRGSGSFLGTIGLSQLGEVKNISPFIVSPVLWAALVLAGAVITLGLARTRWGWPAAVALATLASPRLLLYMLTSLLAAVHEPKQANLEEAEPRPWRFVSGGGRH